MSFVADVFGGGTDVGKVAGKSSKKTINKLFPLAQEKVLGGLNINTGLSNINAATGAVNVDPLGRNLQLGALGTFQGQLGETRESLLGNQGAFQQARVNPLLERLAAGRGELSRGLSRTGVRGTFRDRAIQDFDIAGERAVGDQRAIATQESLSAISSLDAAGFAAGTGVGAQLFNQELQALGLSANTITALKAISANLATGAASVGANIGGSQAQVDASGGQALAGLLGSGLQAAGTAFAPVPTA
jgi:hypothetical protein